MPPRLSAATDRVDWVDYSKGFCIFMVVLMHSTLGVEKYAGSTGFMHYVTDFALPFRMPDFFMISGLFLARVIDRDWRTYLDRKVVHFAYFYVLWFLIQGFFKWPVLAWHEGPAAAGQAALLGLIDPPGSMWFIYLLPIFLVTAKLVRRVPPALVLAVMALLQTVHIETGWTIVDEFGFRGVFFFTGWYFAPRIFAFAAWVRANPARGIAGLLAWAVAEEALVQAGVATLPGISLVLGWAGALAVIAFAAVLARKEWLGVLRYAGEHSLVIYLAFFLPMDVTRTVLLKTHVIPDIGWMSLVVTLVTFVAPLVIYELVKGTRLRFLFERPQMFRLEAPRRPALQPAE
ncbi:MAG TPA: acyltransferase family protein [Hyphomicrobiales bacterium]|nr:acyltransferase family protein [Hyphomicrobiales bacterium]